jgi:hypothetical protein
LYKFFVDTHQTLFFVNFVTALKSISSRELFIGFRLGIVDGVVRVSFLGRVGTVDAVRGWCDSHGIEFEIFARRRPPGVGL